MVQPLRKVYPMISSPRQAMKHQCALILRLEQLQSRTPKGRPERSMLDTYHHLLALDYLTPDGVRHVENITGILES